MIWIWLWYLCWLQNAKTLKLKCLFFSHFMEWNWRPLISKSSHFAASEDTMTKFKSQGLHIIRIKYWNACGSGSPPSFIPTLWNIGILLHKKATLGKHFRPECTFPSWPHKSPQIPSNAVRFGRLKSYQLGHIHSGQKCLPRVAFLWSKMPMFQKVGMREGGEPHKQATLGKHF